MPDFIRVTWIDVDRDKERDVTQEQKQTYELAVNLKENEPTQRSFILDGWKFSIVEIRISYLDQPSKMKVVMIKGAG